MPKPKAINSEISTICDHRELAGTTAGRGTAGGSADPVELKLNR
jgi:hypothetical protein